MSTTPVARATTTEPVAEEATRDWTLTFDLHDDRHCFADVETIVNGLSKTARDYLADELPEDLNELGHFDLRITLDCAEETLRETLGELEDATSEEAKRLEALISEIEQGQWSLEPHLSCRCGTDAWESTREWFDASIAASRTDGVTWAVFDHDGAVRGDLATSSLTVAELYDMTSCRGGWTSVELTWTAATRTLAFSFEGRDCWSGTAVALTPAQETAADELANLDPYQDNPICFTLKADPTAVQVVLNVWGDDDDEDLTQLCHVHDGDPQAAVTAVTALLQAKSGPEKAAIAAMSHGWTASLTDLLDTAVAVAA